MKHLDAAIDAMEQAQEELNLCRKHTVELLDELKAGGKRMESLVVGMGKTAERMRGRTDRMIRSLDEVARMLKERKEAN